MRPFSHCQPLQIQLIRASVQLSMLDPSPDPGDLVKRQITKTGSIRFGLASMLSKVSDGNMRLGTSGTA